MIVDGKGRGAGGGVGLVLGLGRRFELHAGGLFGPTFGAYGGASLHLASGRWRPIVAAGVPVFFDDGARVGVRGAAGVEWRATTRLSILAELGAEYMLGRADDIDPWVLAPAVAAEARL